MDQHRKAILHNDGTRFLLNIFSLHNCEMIQKILPPSLLSSKTYYQDSEHNDIHLKIATQLQGKKQQQKATQVPKQKGVAKPIITQVPAAVTQSDNRATPQCPQARLQESMPRLHQSVVNPTALMQFSGTGSPQMMPTPVPSVAQSMYMTSLTLGPELDPQHAIYAGHFGGHNSQGLFDASTLEEFLQGSSRQVPYVLQPGQWAMPSTRPGPPDPCFNFPQAHSQSVNNYSDGTIMTYPVGNFPRMTAHNSAASSRTTDNRLA